MHGKRQLSNAMQTCSRSSTPGSHSRPVVASLLRRVVAHRQEYAEILFIACDLFLDCAMANGSARIYAADCGAGSARLAHRRLVAVRLHPHAHCVVERDDCDVVPPRRTLVFLSGGASTYVPSAGHAHPRANHLGANDASFGGRHLHCRHRLCASDVADGDSVSRAPIDPSSSSLRPPLPASL